MVATDIDEGLVAQALSDRIVDNAIAQAAKHGISTQGASIYVTLEPCISCLKLIISSGIKEVLYKICQYAEVGLRELKERWQGKVSNQIQADIERIDRNFPFISISLISV